MRQLCITATYALSRSRTSQDLQIDLKNRLPDASLLADSKRPGCEDLLWFRAHFSCGINLNPHCHATAWPLKNLEFEILPRKPRNSHMDGLVQLHDHGCTLEVPSLGLAGMHLSLNSEAKPSCCPKHPPPAESLGCFSLVGKHVGELQRGRRGAW